MKFEAEFLAGAGEKGGCPGAGKPGGYLKRAEGLK